MGFVPRAVFCRAATELTRTQYVCEPSTCVCAQRPKTEGSDVGPQAVVTQATRGNTSGLFSCSEAEPQSHSLPQHPPSILCSPETPTLAPPPVPQHPLSALRAPETPTPIPPPVPAPTVHSLCP